MDKQLNPSYLAQFDRHVVSSPAHLLEGREEREKSCNVKALVSLLPEAVESYYTNVSKCGLSCCARKLTSWSLPLFLKLRRRSPFSFAAVVGISAVFSGV